jgi:hypothetical protein
LTTKNNDRGADVAGEHGLQVRLLAISAVAGALMLGGSLVVELAGLNNPQIPKLSDFVRNRPRIPPRLPVPPALPSGFPTDIPTGFPTDLPKNFPTGLPSIPGLPTPPPVPGGNP